MHLKELTTSDSATVSTIRYESGASDTQEAAPSEFAPQYPPGLVPQRRGSSGAAEKRSMQ